MNTLAFLAIRFKNSGKSIVPLPSVSTSLIISCSSVSVGLCPSDLMTAPNSLVVMFSEKFQQIRFLWWPKTNSHEVYTKTAFFCSLCSLTDKGSLFLFAQWMYFMCFFDQRMHVFLDQTNVCLSLTVWMDGLIKITFMCAQWMYLCVSLIKECMIKECMFSLIKQMYVFLWLYGWMVWSTNVNGCMYVCVCVCVIDTETHIETKNRYHLHPCRRERKLLWILRPGSLWAQPWQRLRERKRAVNETKYGFPDFLDSFLPSFFPWFFFV